jgi:uncharacterized sporulation protein YeaH/YhbH (DUF444 family)
MDEAQRRLAKQFFFFALQGIRRQYTKVETLFLAHAAEDRDAARGKLAELAKLVHYAGYVETGGVATFRPRETQLAEIFTEMKGRGAPVGVSHLGSQEDIWRAIREFFKEQADE